jgi:hypothetical protein
MNEIYLISHDGHRDSINLDGYFTTNEELIDYCKKDFLECNPNIFIESIEIQDRHDVKSILICYYDEWDVKKEYLEHDTYYTFKIEKYECF